MFPKSCVDNANTFLESGHQCCNRLILTIAIKHGDFHKVSCSMLSIFGGTCGHHDTHNDNHAEKKILGMKDRNRYGMFAVMLDNWFCK